MPRQAIASVARWLYNENYVACPTRSTIVDPSNGRDGRLEYGWKHRGGWLSMEASYSGEPTSSAADSQEEFITEHYWGYSAQRDGGTVEYRVEHPKWKVWAATDPKLNGNLPGFYRPEFASALASRPSSAFIADGSPVTVRTGQRIDERLRVRANS